MFTPPENLIVCDSHGGFTAVINGNTLWRPATNHDCNGVLVVGSVKYNDFYQTVEPVVSALYKIPKYRYLIKIWWHPSGTRLA